MSCFSGFFQGSSPGAVQGLTQRGREQFLHMLRGTAFRVASSPKRRWGKGTLLPPLLASPVRCSGESAHRASLRWCPTNLCHPRAASGASSGPADRPSSVARTCLSFRRSQDGEVPGPRLLLRRHLRFGASAGRRLAAKQNPDSGGAERLACQGRPAPALCASAPERTPRAGAELAPESTRSTLRPWALRASSRFAAAAAADRIPTAPGELPGPAS